MNKDYWKEKLSTLERDYNFEDGYKLLYSPWDTIGKVKTAFVSLNPGKAAAGDKALGPAKSRVVSEERGNSYEIEASLTKSPLPEQFLNLCYFLKVRPNEVLTGVVCPFRGKRWEDFNKDQKDIGLGIGREFWSKALAKNIELVITIGKDATGLIVDLLQAKPEDEIPSGWGSIKLRRYINNTKGIKVVQLPHLSTFKLFSRPECRLPLKGIFEVQGDK